MKFGVRNFKIFNDWKVFNIKPITLLVGPNGTGKSTIIQALEVLSKFEVVKTIIDDDYNVFKKFNRVDPSHKIALLYDTQENPVYNIFDNQDFTISNAEANEIRNIASKEIATRFFINNRFTDSYRNSYEAEWEMYIEYKKKLEHISLYYKKKRLAMLFGGSLFVNFKAFYDYYREILNASGEKDQFNFNFETPFLNLILDEKHKSKSLQEKKSLEESASRQFWGDEDSIHITDADTLKILIHNNYYFFSDCKVGQSIKNFYKEFISGIINDITIKCLKQFLPFNFLGINRLVFKKNDLTVENPVNENEFNKLLKLVVELPQSQKKYFDETLNYYFSSLYSLGEEIKISKKENSYSIIYLKKGKQLSLLTHGNGIINLVSIMIALSLADSKISEGLKKIQVKSVNFGSGDNPSKSPINKSYHRSILAIQEPEMNLHPDFQSKIADLFMHSANTCHNTFVIETHSEYLIRRLQYLVAKGELSKDMVQIYYFNNPDILKENDERVYPININDDGSLTRPFGSGFFDEAAKLNLLLYNRTKESNN